MPDALSVLLVDGDPRAREQVRAALRRAVVRLDVTEAGSLAEARRALARRAFDAQVVDRTLPDGDGVDLVEVPAAAGRLVPCVIRAHADDDDDAFTAVDRGAQDVVCRGASTATLVRAIRYGVRRARAAQSPNREGRCALRASVDGVAGAEAVVRDPRSGVSHRIRSDNRAVLLYLLGRRLLDDRRAGTPEAEAGWVADRDVVVGIWGRGDEVSGRNRLHVLVHRMRKELQTAGVPGDVVETRRNALRGRFSGVELD